MIEDIYTDAVHRMDQAVIHTRNELSKVRTGRANPDMFSSLKVSYYGNMTPLNQVANVTVPEPRLIIIQPYEKTLIQDIEKAIVNGNFGVTPSNNGTAVLIPIPALSEERRRDLSRFVHQLVEEGRIAVRNVRRDVLHHLKETQKEDHISEDEVKRQEQRIQELTDGHVKELGEMQELKEKEIMEF